MSSEGPKTTSATADECPECGSDQVVITMKTGPGFYCLCEYCGHIWHCDGERTEPPARLE
jgi:transcription elongation factor Elf1